MATDRRTWQKFEERAAAFFGAKRNVLSGSANRDDRDTSDSTHETLHIEAKLRERFAVHSLWNVAKRAAVGKVPVLCLQEKNRHGFLIVVHVDDFDAVAKARQDIPWGEAGS